MKKYLREIESAGLILMVIGIALKLYFGAGYGAWACGLGLVLLLGSILYKAFHWNEYETENKRYILIILGAVIIQLLIMALAS